MKSRYEEITRDLGIEGFAMFLRDSAKEKCEFCEYKDDEDKCPTGDVTCKDGIKKWLEGSDWD